MSHPVRNVGPYFLNLELEKTQRKSTDVAESRSQFGDSLSHTLAWASGVQRVVRPIRVNMLGTDNDAFYCPPEVFIQSAQKLGGDPLFIPPPFAAPCTDGLLIIFTLKRAVATGIDLHGGYICVPRQELEQTGEPIGIFWRRAQKPATMAVLLKEMGFGETRLSILN